MPLSPAAAKARRSRSGEAYRGHDYTGKRWREDDLPALGRRYREPYATKSTFITLACKDGADPDVIEPRVTHTKKSRSAFEGYRRYSQWPEICSEVAKLRVARRARVTGRMTVLGTHRNLGGNVVEAAGVENEVYCVDLIEHVVPDSVMVAPRVAPTKMGRLVRRDLSPNSPPSASICIPRRWGDSLAAICVPLVLASLQ